MSKWIFIVKSPIEDLKKRVKERSWPIYQHTPNRKKLKIGDNVIFYLAGEEGQKFVGKAIIGSGLTSTGLDYSVGISDVEIWDSPVNIKDVIGEFDFILHKENWGAYFQCGVRSLNDKDYKTVISEVYKK